jgi:ribosomal protein L40E
VPILWGVSTHLAQTEGVTTPPTACPSCGAGVRAGAPWCTQCYFDLRPKAPEPPPVAPVPPTGVPRQPAAAPSYSTDPLNDPLPGQAPAPSAVPTWPCTTCGHDNPLDATACQACGAGFLAAVRDSEAPLLVVPGLGDLGRYSRAQRLALAAGVALSVAVVVLVLGLLLS